MNNRRRTQIINEARSICTSPVQLLILQEANLINKEKLIIDHILRECSMHRQQGRSRELINEDISTALTGFGDNVLDAGIDKFKKYLTDGLMEMIGLDPKQPGGWGLLGCAISNTLEEMPISMFKKIFGSGVDMITGQFDNVQKSWEGMCGELTDVIMKGVTECATEKIQQSDFVLGFYKAFVGDTTIDKASQSFLWGVADEGLQNLINDTQFMTSIRDSVSAGLCALDLESILSSVSSGLGSLSDMILGALGFDGGIAGLLPAGA